MNSIVFSLSILFLIFKIIWILLVSLLSHMHFRLRLSIIYQKKKKPLGNLIWTVLNIYINLETICILIVFKLLIHEHCIPPLLLNVLWLISLVFYSFQHTFPTYILLDWHLSTSFISAVLNFFCIFTFQFPVIHW